MRISYGYPVILAEEGGLFLGNLNFWVEPRIVKVRYGYFKVFLMGFVSA